MDNIIQNTTVNLSNDNIEQQNVQKHLLRNAVEDSLRKYINKLGDNDTPNDIYNMVLAEVESPLLKTIMQYTKGNQSKAAICLGLSRGTLRKKLKAHGFLT